MSERMPQIVALGGGGFSMEPGNTLLDDHLLRLTGVTNPRVCFLPTASGDADHYVVRFYRAFSAERCRPSHVSLFRRDRGFGDLGDHLLGQDLIYVGGGSVLSLLGAWRAHGIDDILAECWRRGVVLAGLSAGSLCWFAEAITAFHGPAERVRGLGLLPYANCVHYDGEPERREAFHRLLGVSEAQPSGRGRSPLGGMRDGYAASDGAALHFVGHDLERVVTSRPSAQAFRVRCSDGVITESELETTFLGAVPVAA